jgi:hypothetical protein
MMGKNANAFIVAVLFTQKAILVAVVVKSLILRKERKSF